MHWNDKALKMLSLTDTEATILDALTEPKSVQQLAQDTSLSRTGINYAIQSLVTKELVTPKKVGKRYVYAALSLEGLAKKLQKTLEDIEVANREKKGVRVRISKRDEFIIHVGSKEIIPAYKRIAAENKNERIHAIQHHRSWNELIEKISPKQLAEFNEAIKANHIILDALLNEGAYEAYQKEIAEDPQKNLEAVKSLEGRMADYAVFPDEFFNYDAEIWIFKTTTLMINWKEGVAIEITNANMTGFLTDMFKFVKAGGRMLDHHKALKTVWEKKDAE
ncbi:MAG: hypothetical protein RL141_736 [Candidatus Parcubacteria bacterium]|jgi:predicted transcriptional regulator